MGTLLVIGYGNTLRRDDGAGPRVAATVETLNLPDVHTHTCHQLTPELADLISRFDAVVFADATVSDGGTELCEIKAGDTDQIMAHATSPPAMLGLAKELFGRCPRAWTLAIPASDLEFGEGLSLRAEAGCRQGVNLIRSLLRQLAPAPLNK